MGIPPVDLLESVHTFPGPYTFKVIGQADHAFVARVMLVVREKLKMDQDPPFTLRQSEHGRHLAITITPTVNSAQQVQDLYRELMLVQGVSALL